ncbi:MAG: SMC-Scp complex subunit ScpB [Candidatus Omnitrophica bacterium]|nr:SMC-Scp complex subunit ScpB [Candidatus Omnitrophota bacterium]MBU1128161.1 SMC-Scp complex subunit ScpB [Candidatus Omnitrophota bacterium]MBU1785083.1 SMC-Scp complex subunit ScpB [Candidatus Omnitrophota bacterium]
MENIEKTKKVVEALLIVSGDGLRREVIMEVIKEAGAKEINECIALLNEEYDRDERAFTITELAGRYRIVTRPEYMPWIKDLYQTGPERLTGPSLETLAIVAYKQPVTKAEIEFVRGVNVGGVLKTLLEKGLITVKGRKDIVGKPLIYGTTEKFMEFFGLNTLDDLPMLKDFKEEDLEYGRPPEGQVVKNIDDEKNDSDDGDRRRQVAHYEEKSD